MSKLTLDEAIKHCLEVAEEQSRFAELLTELKAYKRLRICRNCRHYVCGTTHFGECHVTSDIEPCVVAAAETACDTFFNYNDLEMEENNNG